VAPNRVPPSRAAWIALAVVLLFTAAVRMRVLDAPLERDEGEYAYAGQLILSGVPPYAEVYNMKLPGIYAAYAVVLAIFPDTPGGIHAGLMLVNAATILLVFLLGRRLGAGLGDTGQGDTGQGGLGSEGGERADLLGVLAAAFFAVLTLGKSTQGLFANAEHFVLLPALAALLLLLRGIEAQRLRGLAAAGLLFGVAFLVKQHGAAFALFGFLWLAWKLGRGRFEGRRLAALGLFVGCGFIPLLVTMGVLAAAGIFDAFWWWTFEYAWIYVGQMPIEMAPGAFWFNGRHVFAGAPLVWGAAVIGLSALVWDPGTRGRRLFLALLFVLSFLAICPGFFFRQHYFVLLTPAVSLLGAVGLVALARLVPGRRAVIAGVLGLVCLGQSLAWQFNYLFRLSPVDITRNTFPMNPFAESVEVARIVERYTKPGDRIAVLGSEPQIAFYSRRRLATGFIYMYPLTEPTDYAETLQRQMIEEVERNAPEIIVAVNVHGSWLADPSTRPILRDWIESLGERYARLGQIRVDPRGLDLPASMLDANLNVVILKKKP